MIRRQPHDLLNPRFFVGVTKQRLEVRAAQITGRPVKVDVDGATLLVPAHDRLVPLLREEHFEAAERAFVRSVLRPGDNFWDVGAHVGLYTITAGKAVGPTGTVVAVEPNPLSFRLLERNVAANNLQNVVACVAAAVSDTAATGTLSIPDRSHHAWSTLGSPAVGADTTVEVRTVTLDLLSQQQPPPFVVKIDVEGWEQHVLAGGSHLLGRRDAPHLLVEFSDITAAGAGTTSAGLWDSVEQFGYRLYRLDLEPEVRRSRYGTANLVASKNPWVLADRLR